MTQIPKDFQRVLNLHLLENPAPLKKTLDFYGVIDDNAWNRPATASKKIFQFYHKDNQSKQHLIQSLKERQINEGKIHETKRKIRVLTAKNDDKLRLEARTLETNRLQYTSNQMLNIWDEDEEKLNRISVEDIEIKKMLAKKGVKIINRDVQVNEWNNYTRIPRKTVDIIANDKIIKNDEDAVKFIGEKIKNEKNGDLIRKQLNLMKREKELAVLKKNHLNMYNFEKKIYGKVLPPPPNNENNEGFPYKFYNKENLLQLYNKKLTKQELFERLSIPKEVFIYILQFL